MKRFKTMVLTATFIAGMITVPAQARTVIVNNQLMNQTQLLMMDMINCTTVPDGNYWVNNLTGQWGYAGGGVKGYVGDACRQSQPRKSLSERGLLYSPGELLR